MMVLVACAIMGLAGCASTAPPTTDGASSLLAKNIPPWAGGEPSSVPSPPTVPPQPIDVFVVPQARPVKAMDADEQKKLQSDLIALRNRTFAQGKAAQAIDPTNLPARLADRRDGADQAASTADSANAQSSRP